MNATPNFPRRFCAQWRATHVSQFHWSRFRCARPFPSWEQLAMGAVEVPFHIFDNQPRKGRQAARAVETHFWGGEEEGVSHADAVQQGRQLFEISRETPCSCSFHDFSPRTGRASSTASFLVFRKLRLLLSLTTRWCVCGRFLANLGHHRAACSVEGILGRRGFPFGFGDSNRPLLRMNVSVRDRCVGQQAVGCRRGRGLSLQWRFVGHGHNSGQPIQRDGTPRPRTQDVNVVALQHSQRNREATYTSWWGEVAARGLSC